MLCSPTPDFGTEFALALSESLRQFSLGRSNPCTAAAPSRYIKKSPEPAECKEKEQLSNSANPSATQSPSKQTVKLIKHSLQGIRVLFVEDAVLCDRIFTALNKVRPEFVGFDCEWNSKPNVCSDCTKAFDRESSQVSLLQIAHASIIVLVRMHCFTSSEVPQSLRKFLGDNKILKVGVGIYYDCKKLKRSHGVNVRGWIEINKEFRTRIDEREQLALFDAAQIQFNGFASLATLCEVLLGKEMQFKNARFDKVWDAPYDYLQTMYAAEDALIGFQIFDALRQRCEHEKGQFRAADTSLITQQIEALEKNDESLALMLQNTELLNNTEQKHIDRVWQIKREMETLQNELASAQQRLERYQTDQVKVMRTIKEGKQSKQH